MSMTLPDEAEQFLTDCIGSGFEATPLHGDASVRAYYRVKAADGRNLIVSYYPEAIRADIQRFVDAYEAIASSTRVPSIVKHCSSSILQHDVGSDTIFDAVRRDPSDGLRLYKLAIDLLVDFQKSPLKASIINPPFDAQKFRDELEMTREFYVERLAGVTDRERLESISHYFELNASRIAQHPYLLCHRDYHGQNIHLSGDALFMIDYQDLRLGPDTYDLASLLRDRGTWKVLGADAERELVEYYRTLIGAGSDMELRYYETLLQRSIKAIGTFAKQAITRDRRHYLDFIPSTLESVRHCIDHLPAYEPLQELFPLDYAQ